MTIIPHQPLSYDDFPASNECAQGMIDLPMDKDAIGTRLYLDVPYITRDGAALHLQILVPYKHGDEGSQRFPLIVYVQGSAWRKQDIHSNMMQLERIASRGYVVAIVEYRPSDIAPFPAQIQDTKTAIRFLRSQAAAYHIDGGRVVVMGDSSGGHTAVMAGFTAHLPQLDTDAYGEHSCAVSGIVDYYGPTDVGRMCLRPSTMDHITKDSPEGRMVGGYDLLDHPEKVAPTVVMNYVCRDRALPPLLMLHGTKDRLVPFNQSVMLYEKMKAEGKQVTFYRIKNGDHGGPAFWTPPVLDAVCSFISACF